MNDHEALRAAAAEFAKRIEAIDESQWTTPTPCGEWDVTALVNHLNVGNRMSVLLLDGADAKTSVGPAAQPAEGSDPVATYTATSAEQGAAFDAAGALTMIVKHPAMEMPGDALLMFRALDMALHAWDLSTSIGTDTTIDPELCDWLWSKLEPIAPLLAVSGMFGNPTGSAPEEASAQQKLLHATGRWP